MALSTTKPATEKQVMWLADLMHALGEELDSFVIDDFRRLSRDAIRIRIEQAQTVLAHEQGTPYARVERVFGAPKATRHKDGA